VLFGPAGETAGSASAAAVASAVSSSMARRVGNIGITFRIDAGVTPAYACGAKRSSGSAVDPVASDTGRACRGGRDRGAPVNLPAAHEITIRDGYVVRFKVYLSRDDALEAAGPAE